MKINEPTIRYDILLSHSSRNTLGCTIIEIVWSFNESVSWVQFATFQHLTQIDEPLLVITLLKLLYGSLKLD